MLYSPVFKLVSKILSKTCIKINNFFYDVQSLQSSKRDLLALTNDFAIKLRSEIEIAVGDYSAPGIDQWLVYSIDDLLGFSRGNPMFCTVVAGTRGAEVTSCTVLVPVMKEVFLAEKGKGLFMEDISGNICRMRVSKVNVLSEALIGSNVYEPRVSQKARRYYMGGSGLLDFVNLASGRIDAYLFKAVTDSVIPKIGDLIVAEGGGCSSNSSGLYIASNALIHTDLISSLTSV